MISSVEMSLDEFVMFIEELAVVKLVVVEVGR
jgi:hypothetical protein